MLVNNAGVESDNLPLEFMPLDSWQRLFATNVFGLVEVTKRAVPLMRAAGGGVICNITSSSTLAPVPFLGTYRASKAAVTAIGESLAAEVAQFGIRVVEIMPGPIETDMLAASDHPPAAAEHAEYRELAERMWEGRKGIRDQYTPAAEAARRIVDAICDDDGPLRYGCDDLSEGMLDGLERHRQRAVDARDVEVVLVMPVVSSSSADFRGRASRRSRRSWRTNSAAIRFSPDEWLGALGARSVRPAVAGARRSIAVGARAAVWCCCGQTVIIDWGVWARAERDTVRNRARELGVAIELHLPRRRPLDVLWTRRPAPQRSTARPARRSSATRTSSTWSATVRDAAHRSRARPLRPTDEPTERLRQASHMLVGLERVFELDLVADRDAVRARLGEFGFELRAIR